MSHETESVEDFFDIIPGTPEFVVDTLQKEYQTPDLTVRLFENDGLGPDDWFPECPELHYDVLETASGIHIGDVSVFYDYESKLLNIGTVGIFDDAHKGKGYGKQIYKLVPHIMMPCGRMPAEAGFDFVTEHPSHEAERVWKSLEREGLVVHMGGTAYWWALHTPETAAI